MVIDLKRCVGCQSCTVACKAENGTPQGVYLGRVLEQEVGTYPNAKREFLPVLCNQCEDAPCLRACPTGATYQLENGIIDVDNKKCIGCRTCYVSCPYHNRFYVTSEVLKRGAYGNGHLTPYEKAKLGRYEAGTVTKCDFCAHRVAEGLDPACVITCPAKARTFGDLNDPGSEVNRLIHQRRGYQLHPEYQTKPSVYYIE
ncbi:MAG: 4Fe-4S dicluster domain-containing protein [Chloroflexi bacterium]|nr:4Fe-4S dicluster domain-containing protein [Chloroflexota bacterium]